MKKYYGAFNFRFSELLDQQRWDYEMLSRGDYIDFINIKTESGTPIIYNNKVVKDIRILYEDDQSYIFTVSFTFEDETTLDVTDDGMDEWWINTINNNCNIQFTENVLCYAEYVYYPDNFNSNWNSNIARSSNIIYLYKLNSSKNTVDKNLTFVDCSPIRFNNPIKYRDMEIAIKWGVNDETFNYIYISSLKRYYFVMDMVLTNDYALLTLHEDVLTSHADLIRMQRAQIQRNENLFDDDIIDTMVTYEYDKDVSFTQLTDLLNLFTYTTGEEITDIDGTPIGTPDDFGFVITVVRS